EELLNTAKLLPPEPCNHVGLRLDSPSPITHRLSQRVGLGVLGDVDRGRILADDRHPVNRDRRQGNLADPPLEPGGRGRSPSRGPSAGTPSDRGWGEHGYRGHRRDLFGSGDRHVLAALLASALLAGHPRIDLEPRTAALAEKNDTHGVLPLVLTALRAFFC